MSCKLTFRELAALSMAALMAVTPMGVDAAVAASGGGARAATSSAARVASTSAARMATMNAARTASLNAARTASLNAARTASARAAFSGRAATNAKILNFRGGGGLPPTHGGGNLSGRAYSAHPYDNSSAGWYNWYLYQPHGVAHRPDHHLHQVQLGNLIPPLTTESRLFACVPNSQESGFAYVLRCETRDGARASHQIEAQTGCQPDGRESAQGWMERCAVQRAEP